MGRSVPETVADGARPRFDEAHSIRKTSKERYLLSNEKLCLPVRTQIDNSLIPEA